MVPSYRTMVDNWDATMKTNWEDEATRPPHIQVYMDNFGPIPLTYHVHHIDNNHENNSPTNLIALPRTFHNNLHSDYAFYYNLAKDGRISKKLLQALLNYYNSKGYSLSKNFTKVLVEYLITTVDPDLKSEPPQIIYKDRDRHENMLKKVRGALAPLYKQNDLLFGSGGIYDKLSKKQVDKCFKKVLKEVSELYSKVKENQA